MTPRQSLAAAVRRAAAAVGVAVQAYDACPVATHALAERAKDAHWLRADKAANANPEYAAIQAHCTECSPGPGPLLDTSGHDISWTDFETQLRISSQITPTPPWWPLASFVADRPIRRLAGRAEAA